MDRRSVNVSIRREACGPGPHPRRRSHLPGRRRCRSVANSVVARLVGEANDGIPRHLAQLMGDAHIGSPPHVVRGLDLRHPYVNNSW